MSWISEIKFTKKNFLTILDITKNKCVKKSSKKNYSLVQLSDVRHIGNNFNIFLNLNFFLGLEIPTAIISKILSLSNSVIFQNIFMKENIIKKEWNTDIKFFLTNIDEFDILHILQCVIQIDIYKELPELFFVLQSDFTNLLDIYISLSDDIEEIKNQNNIELSKIEFVVNDFKKDNKYLVNLLDEIEQENQLLNQKISQLNRENTILQNNLQKMQKELTTESIKQKNENYEILMNNNHNLKKELILLESANRDLLNENEKLYERATARKRFWFC